MINNKNSFIYFQIGLISSMLLILFLLEFKFENKKEYKRDIKVLNINDEIFEYKDYKIIKEIKYDKNLKDVIIKSKINIKKINNNLEIVKDNIEVENDTNENDTNESDIIEDNKIVIDDDSKSIKNNVTENNIDLEKTYSQFSVERLPMFYECVDLDISKQKECFEKQLYKEISKNLIYPENDLENGIQGTSLIEFIIDEKGNITNIKPIINGRSTELMNNASIKAIKKLPKLIPAKQGDYNVKVKYIIPISFRIN